ncbi:phage tail protein [Pseudomonas argentinensis]|uniref:Uncharacterized protein n=1 Tax=Phytopseudomonas argentinensis TaxID=289370 RepID=A0A1I3I6K3_9GAMM|nr:hypothetical protein [Pseudomonas argentinensis]KAB0547892.1 phage tail protein [Pseudomonas argentinensis]SFI43561.1 hypothetical protein SAMN05216602_1457 [Pseudomonas argentinensis]
MRYYSKTTGTTYLSNIHSHFPDDAVPITEERYLAVIANAPAGKVRSHDDQGLPILIDPPPYVPTADELCHRVDTAADAARRAVAGDPMRAVEYDRTRLQAEQFAAAGYQGEVPPMVAAWVTSERDAQAAAEDILREAALYEEALVQVRTIRLQAKEQIRALMAAGDVDQAARLTEQTIADLAACVQGVGNA